MFSKIYYYQSRFGVGGIISAIKSRFIAPNCLIKVKRENIKFPFYLRSGTSDVPTFDQIFIDEEYNFESLNKPKVIVDAGANVGLASIYFANKFPDAKIISIEPERSNFELLEKNTSPYPNITCIHAALWNQNKKINLIDPGLGKWGFMTEESGSSEKSSASDHGLVDAITVEKIVQQFKLSSIDILKIDIEGAEREVFKDSSPWLEKINSIIIELHDRMKPGCSRSFYNGSNGFDREWYQGENVYLSRNNCIIENLRKRTSI